MDNLQHSSKIVLITSNRHFSYISIFMFSKPFKVKWFVVYEEASFVNLHSSYSHREIIHIFQHKHGRASYYLGKKYTNVKVSENDITNLMAQTILVTPSQLFCLTRDPITRIRVFSFCKLD